MRRVILAALGALALAGCRGGTSTEPPVLYPNKIVELALPITSMNFQPRYRPQGENEFWQDARDAREPPPGTVARGHLQVKNAYFTGLGGDGQPVAAYPVPVDMKLVQRGQQRFNVFCAPCHDRTGSGRGLVPRRGWIPPPNFHSDAILAYTPGQFFQVITGGIRTMPSYAAQIPVEDRWAIVSYVQALQRAGHASLSEIPEGVRSTLR